MMRLLVNIGRLARGLSFVCVAGMSLVGSARGQVAIAPSGEGTQANPYQITQLGNLVWMGDNVGSSAGKYYKLMNDIDASSTAGWNGGAGFEPIGPNGTHPFFGTFDGNGKAIRHLTIHRPSEDNVGLFGVVGGAIGWVKDITLSDCDVRGDDYVGGVAGDCGGTLSGCSVSGSVSGAGLVGGVTGGVYGDGLLLRCHSSVAVTSDLSYVGGLVGYVAAPGNLTISECSATGAVSGNNYVGGLVGFGANISLSVRQCYAKGRVTGTGGVAGGLVGALSGAMIDCYATGSVTSYTGVGGLVGSIGYVGASVCNCYSTGSVSGNGDYIGGLIGLNDGQVVASYWDTQTSGQVASAGGTGKTTAQMKQQATFSGWDFLTVWNMTENVTYPFLRVAWDTGYTDLGGGWRRLTWFGDYVPMGSAGWIWHNKHGFFYVAPASTPQNIWLYAQDMGWLYTGNAIYPFLYRANDRAWLWYNGATNPRWFVNMATGQWERHD